MLSSGDHSFSETAVPISQFFLIAQEPQYEKRCSWAVA